MKKKIGDSILVMGPADPEGAFPAKIFVYLDDVDVVYETAVQAGAQSLMAPTQQFYGQRSARVKDSGGNIWVISTQTENLTQEETHKRFADLFK